MVKVRNIVAFPVIVYLFFATFLTSFAQDSIRIAQSDSLGFNHEEIALDSIVSWLKSKKPTLNAGLIPESLFMSELRKIDTITPYYMAKAQYIQYRVKQQKSFKKFSKYIRKNNIHFKISETSKSSPASFEKKYFTYKISSPFIIRRYEFNLKWKKEEYTVDFMLWWIDGKGYWTDDFRIYLK